MTDADRCSGMYRYRDNASETETEKKKDGVTRF